MRRKFSRYCTSCIRLLLLLALVAGAFNARAGVSSGQADGYLDRGIFMHDASINLMALDQLVQYASISGGDEKTALLTAPQSMLTTMLPVGSGLLIRLMFKAGRQYPRECKQTRMDIDRKLSQAIAEW